MAGILVWIKDDWVAFLVGECDAIVPLAFFGENRVKLPRFVDFCTEVCKVSSPGFFREVF